MGVHNVANNNALNDLKDKAAQLGATHYVLVNLDAGSQMTTASALARAYKCD